MIKDTQTANLNKNKKLETIFPKSFEFICGTMGYNVEQFNLLLKKKCIQVSFYVCVRLICLSVCLSASVFYLSFLSLSVCLSVEQTSFFPNLFLFLPTFSSSSLPLFFSLNRLWMKQQPEKSSDLFIPTIRSLKFFARGRTTLHLYHVSLYQTNNPSACRPTRPSVCNTLFKTLFFYIFSHLNTSIARNI